MNYLSRFLGIFLGLSLGTGLIILLGYISFLVAAAYGPAYGLMITLFGVCALAAATAASIPHP